jgi:hypothetical protein
MNKHDERKATQSALMLKLKWPQACFEAEARADAREQQHLPRPRHSLKAGDRVSFDLGEGVDGPAYATNVRIIQTK